MCQGRIRDATREMQRERTDEDEEAGWCDGQNESGSQGMRQNDRNDAKRSLGSERSAGLVISNHLLNGLMLSATESATCSLEMMPITSDGRPRPSLLTTTTMLASRRAMR